MSKPVSVRCRRGFWAVIAGAIAWLLGRPEDAKAADYGYHPGHNCPRCGRLQVVVYRRGPGIYHTHKCGSTIWHH